MKPNWEVKYDDYMRKFQFDCLGWANGKSWKEHTKDFIRQQIEAAEQRGYERGLSNTRVIDGMEYTLCTKYDIATYEHAIKRSAEEATKDERERIEGIIKDKIMLIDDPDLENHDSVGNRTLIYNHIKLIFDDILAAIKGDEKKRAGK